MKNEYYNVLGVMSGTSLDGVDIACIQLQFDGAKWVYQIKAATTLPYTAEWVERFKNAIGFDKAQLELLNQDYTFFLGNLIKNFISGNGIKDIDAVCSHGHTILHQPKSAYTLQIGNLPEISKIVGATVVCDFRVQDVQMGGQGAPLVPIGDRLLFADYDLCLNLGGFSNISFEDRGERVAYDICAVNTVLNFYANKLGLPYDDKGNVAASGILIPELLEQLNCLEYYKTDYPKSLGFEYVKVVLLPMLEKYDKPISDILNTFTVHIAQQIVKAVKGISANRSLLVTGGGAYNTFLIDMVREALPNTNIVIPDDNTIQFKEALIFALLGVLKLRNEVNVLASVTGASANHSSGKIYSP